MSEHFDVVVAGAGGMGSAAIYHLARRGVKVCGIEQFPLVHDRGSSHGDTRIIRKAYFLHPDYVPLLHRAYTLWDELQTEYGKPLIRLNGLICGGEPDSALIRGLESCYSTHALPYERWNAGETRKHFPQFHFPESWAVYFDPTGGFLWVEECVKAHLELARRHGATLYDQEAMVSWEAVGNSVRIMTSRREIHASKLVLTSGAWMRPVMQHLGQPLTVLRKMLFWYKMRGVEDFSPDRFPVFICKFGNIGTFGFPSVGGELKAAEDSGGQWVDDPLNISQDLLPEDEVNVRPFMERTFPGRIESRTRFKTCLYTMTSDRHFIVDLHPEHSNVVLCSACSGHGFKFASVMGELLADMAQCGNSKLLPELFRIKRVGN